MLTFFLQGGMIKCDFSWALQDKEVSKNFVSQTGKNSHTEPIFTVKSIKSQTKCVNKVPSPCYEVVCLECFGELCSLLYDNVHLCAGNTCFAIYHYWNHVAPLGFYTLSH